MTVTPIKGQPGRYNVSNVSFPPQCHVVDIIYESCGCVSWTTRQRRYRERTGRQFYCRHMTAVKQYEEYHLADAP
jgi:hypothetical protein